MGDRTFYRLALPADLDREAVRAAAVAFTDESWTDSDLAQLGHGNTLWVDVIEHLVGECRTLAEAVLQALHDQGADVAFTVTEDPKFEWLGTMCRYHPDLGMHEVDCDAAANALLTDGWFRAINEECGGDDGAVVERISALLGLNWQTPRAV